MNKKLKLLVIAIIIAIFGGIFYFNNKSEPDNREVIVMGTAPGFKPFEYSEKGQIIGFDIDLAKEVANDYNKKLVIEEMNFDGLIAALQAGKIHFVAAGMTVTEDRAKSIDFSNSYYSASQMIVVHNSNNQIKSKDDLKGKKVGVQLGTTGDEMAKKMGLNRVQFSAVPAVLQELRSGRIDAVILDDAPARIYTKTNPDIKVLDQKLSEEQYAMAVAKGHPELLKQINHTIARVKQDGTYEKLIDKFFTGNLSYKRTILGVFLEQDRYMYLVKGLIVTISLALIATLIGVVIGLFTALMRISNWKPFKFLAKSKFEFLRNRANFNPLESIAKFYTTVIRGTPLLVQLLIIYYVVFGSQKNISKIFVAAVAFGINSGAYVAELIRAGFENLPKGQWEASKTIGLSYPQTIFYVTMPQAMKAALPSLISEFITLLKETSIVGWIGLTDLMRGADNIRFETATAFESLIAAALIYLSLTTIFTRLMGKVERKLKVDDRD